MRELDLSKNVGQQKPDYSLIRTPDEVSRGVKHVFTNDELREQAAQTAAEEIRPDGMSASNLVPIAPPQDIAPAQEGTPAYDYFQLKLKGVDDRAIWNNSTQITNYNKTQGKPSMDVIMPDREEAWEGYGKEVFKGDRTVFDSQFDNTTKRLVEFTDNVKKDLYFAYNDSDLVKDPRPGFSTVQGMAIADPEASNKYPDLAPKRTGYIYDQYGELQATKSRSQVADDNEFVIKEGKKISADQFYKERSSEYNIDLRQYDHLVLANDNDGSITGEAGKVYWKAVDASQSIKGSEIRSLWGPSSLYNNWAQDLGGSAINSFVFNLFSIVGSLEEVIGTGLKSIGAESFGKSLQESGNRMQNVSSALYFSPSEMQNMGVEGTTMREVGGLVGMVAQAALGGAAIKGGLMLVGKAAGIGAQATKLTAMELAALESGEMASLQAAGLSATEASAVLAKSALKGKNALSTYALNTYAAQRSAAMMKTGFALMMTDGMHQGAKEAGLGEKERALVFGASFATNMFLMGRGAKWFAPNTGQVWRNVLGSGEAMEVAKKTFAPIIKDGFEKVAINLGKPVGNLVAAEAKVVNNTAIQRVMGNLAKKKPIAYTIDAAKGLSKIMKNSANPMLSHMTTAPIEFGMLHVAGNFIQGAHDYLAEDNLNEQGRLNTPGEGLFKEKESRFDLADGLGHSLLTGLVMGAYGGIGESYAYRKNPQLRHQERTITDFLFAGKGEELKTAFDKMHNEEWYGSSHLDANGEVIRAGQVDPVTGEKVQSLNDIGYNSAKASFDALEEVYNTSGIKQWHLGVKDAKGVNQRYLKDAFDKEFAAVLETVIDPAQVAKDAVQLVVDKNKLKSDLETATTDKDKLNIQKEIETIDNQLNPFLESVAKQNSSGKKVISNVESRAIRNGMVKSRYASGKDPITKLPTFGVDLNIIKGVKSEFGEFQSIDDINADVVDLLNKRANDLIDPAVIGKARDENNTEVLSIVEDIKGGINSDILGRVQTLHSKHLTSGVRPSEKLALDNMISELQNTHDANSETIISELSAKYGVEINEGNAGNFQQVYNEALAKDPAAATTHGATIEALSNTDGTINRVSAEISAAYKKGEMSDADVLKYVYTSNNAGFSLDEIIKNIEKTDFTNPADIHMLNDVLKQIVDKVEILDINKQVYNKLDDQISLLNSKIAPTDKDVDHTLDGSIKKELFDLFDRAFRLKDKATTISSQARELFDAAFVSRDTNIRIVSIENISSIITFVNARDFNSDKDINDTIDLIDVDKIKIENLKNENSIVYNKITVLEELRQNKTITDDQINELNELHKQNSSLKYDIFSHVVSAEHKIHQIFNSKNGEKFYKEVVRNINEFFLQGKEENIGNFGLGYNSNPPEITPSEPNQSLDRKSIKDNLNRSWYYSPELLTASSQSANIYQRSYAYQNAINSVTNIKRHSPKTFYENYKAWEDHYIKNDPNFIAPSFEQQRSIYQSVAFLLDPRIEGIKSKTFIENSLSILGFAGVGKTKVMVPAIIDLYLKENQNRGIKTRETVIFTAPHAKQRENLKSSIQKINIKEDENKPLVDLKTILDDKEPKLRDLLTDRILVIDEASELSKEDVLKLKELQKKYGFKILNLIDESQITGQKGELFAPVLDSQKTTPVTDVHRTGIYDIVRLQQIFREPLFDPTTSKFFVNYSPTEFTEAEGSDYAIKGVKLRGNEFTSITEQSNSFVTDLKKDIADGVAGKTVFVVATDADRETLINELSKSGINKDTLESSIKTLYGKETTAKGLQFDRVYVNLKESSITNESEYYKALLTAASRGISLVDIVTTKPSASIVSAKKASLFSDNAEYKTAVEASYKEYAAKQPELINQILKNATSSSIKSTIPSVERPPADPGSSGPPDSGATKAGQTAEKDSAGNPASTKLITPTEKLESTYDAKVPETTENITKSYTDKDGNQVYLKEELEGTVTGVRAVKLTDGVNETLITLSDFENNYNESQEPIEIESIDTSTQSSYKGEDTVVKEFHPESKDKNSTARVSSLYVDLFPEAQQQVYNKAKDHLLKTQLLNPKNPLNGYLKKVFINQFESGTGGNKKVFKKGIYNVVDVEGLSENYMSIFGTQTPELVDNKYFIFGLETNVDGFEENVDKLSLAIELASTELDPAKYYDDLVGQYKDVREHQINRDRFVDRANAYKLASLNSTKKNNKVTELSNIIIDKFTNGNTVFGSTDIPLSELLKPKTQPSTPTTDTKADVEDSAEFKASISAMLPGGLRDQTLIKEGAKQIPIELWIKKVRSSKDFSHLANSLKKHEGIILQRGSLKADFLQEAFVKLKDFITQSDAKQASARPVVTPTPTVKVNGMYPVEMQGKTVYFSDPHLIHNPDKITNTTIVKYKKGNEEVFEPGYYIYYTLDPNGQTRGMIKVKSSVVTKDNAISLFKNYFINSKDKGSFLSNAFYDDMNRFISTNRQFFDKLTNNNPKNKKEAFYTVTSKENKGVSYQNYKVQAFKTNDEIDFNKTKARIAKIIDALEKNHDTLDIKMHSFPAINPKNSEILTFNSKENLTVNLENINWPQIVTHEGNVRSSINTKSGAETNPFLEDSGKLDFSIDTTIDSPNPNAPKGADLLITDGGSSSEPVTQGKTENVVTKKELTRDEKAKNGLPALNTILGSNKNAKVIIDNISRQVINRSNLSRNLNPSTASGTLSVSDAINSAFEFYKSHYNDLKNAEFEITSEGNTVIKTIDELTYNDVLDSGKEDVRNAYFVAQIVKESEGFRPIFDTAIKQIFPKTILYTDAEAKAVQSETQFDHEDLSKNSSITTKLNQERTSPAKGYSDQMKMVLNSIVYSEYYRDSNGELKTTPTKTGFTPDDTISLFADIKGRVGSLISPLSNNFNVFKKEIENALRNSTNLKPGEKSNSNSFNKLASLYYSFFHDKFAERFSSTEFSYENPLGGYSYLDWVKNQDAIHKEMFNGLSIDNPIELSNGQFSDKVIIQKGKEASLILSEFQSVVTSNVKKEYIHSVYNDKEGQVYRSKSRSTTVSQFVYNIKQALKGSIYHEVEGIRSINRGVELALNDAFYVSLVRDGVPQTELFTKAEIDNLRLEAINNPKLVISNVSDQSSTYGFRIEQDGVYVVDSDAKRTKIVNRNVQKNLVVYSFESNDNGQILRNVKSLFKQFGINDIVSSTTINSYLNESINHIEHNNTFDTQIKNNVNKATLAEVYYNLIEEIGKKEIPGSKIAEEFNQAGSDIEKGILDWGFIQDLATVESINLSKSNIYWKLNPSGDKVYTIQHSSALTDVFNSNNVNRAISDNFYENLSLSKGPSPMIDEKGFLYNPLFNNSEISLVPNEYNILDLNISNGAERFKSGKSVSQMSRYERYRDEIDANFINQLIKASPSRNWSGPKRKGYTEYGITVPGLTSAADIFYLNINATDQRSSPVLIREGNTNTKDNKPRAKANWDYFSYSFLREFQKQRNYQEISTEQLTNAIKEFDFGKFLNIKNAKTNSAISNRIVDTFNIERAKLLRNPDSIQRFFDDVININPEVAKVFFDHLEQSKSVDNNTHYKYVKGKVVVGNSVNYKFTNSKNGNVIDDVFTLNNFNKINDYLESKGYTMKSILDSSHKIHESKILDEEVNKNVKGFMRQLVTQRMKNFINDLHKNNIYANEKTRNFFETEQDLEASGNVNKRGLVRYIRTFDQKEWDAMTQEDRDHFENSYYRTKGGYWDRNTSAWVPSYKDAKHTFTEINPFYEGYLLASLNHSNHINDFVMGDSRAYDNLSQISHRTYTATTPGIHYTIRDNGIGFKNTARYIIYNDSQMNVKNPIARLFGNAIKDSTSSVDGLEWQTGIDGIIQQYSLGLNVVKNAFGHKKEIYNSINLLTGKKVSLKSSTMNLKGYRKNSKEFREIERKMLSIEKFEDNGKLVTLYDKLVEFEMNDEAVVDWMFQVSDGVNKARQVINDKGQLIDIRDAYASRLMPPSVAKIHSGAAVVDLGKEFTGADTFEANMNSRLYVLDLNKESRDSESTYSQQMGTTLMMGKSNEKETKSTLHNLTEFNDSNTKKLSKVGADGIKKLLREKIGSMPNIGNTVEIVGDIRFGNHLSILNKSIRSFLGLEFSNGIKPKMKSSGAYVQYPGEFVTMYEIGADVLSYNKGQAFTLSQYEKALVKLKASGIDSPEALFGERVGENKGLKSTKAYVVEGGKEVDIESFEYLSKIYTPEQLALAFENGVMRDVSRLTPEQQDFIRLTPKQKNDIVKQIITTGGKITPYEIIMPFQQYVEFGFNNNPKDPFYYKNFDVDDILTFKSKDGREINYNDLGATPEERKLALGELIQTHSISNETIAFNRLLNNKNFEEKENDGIKEIDINEVYEKMSEYYENFISITEQFLNRTPASTSASGFRGNVIAFDNDISNTVLVSSKKNVIDNSDYDIDEVHAVTKTIPGLGQKAFAENSEEAALNKIISNNLESYKNPDNLIPNSTPVGTDVLESIIGKIQGAKAKNLVKDFLNDVTTNSKQGRSAMDGEELPGIFANAIKTYIHIYHSVSKIKGDHFAPIELFGKTYSRFFERNRSQGTDTGYDIVNNLASLLQAAVDNNKLGYLGELNTNTTTANAIIAMSMMNIPGETIFNFIKESNFKVSSVIKDVMQYRNINQSNKKDFHFVTKSWTGVIAKAKAEISELNDALKNPLDTKKKEEITNTILEKIDNLALTIKMWSRYIPKRATKVAVAGETIDKAVGQEELDKLENQEMIDYDPLDGDINEGVTEFNKDKTIEYNFNKTLNWLDSYSSDVSALEKVMIIGDKLSKVAKVLGINQGIKSSEWQVYDYLKNLEELKSPSEASRVADTRAQDAVVNQFTINSVAKMGVVKIPSEKELIDEANAVFGNFLDFNKFLDTLPHIKSYINSLYKFDNILSKNILSSNNVFKIQEELFLSKSRQTRIKYQDAYDEMVVARNKVISSMYLETRGKSLENTGLNYDYNTKTISGTSDISTPEGQLKYKYNLHELIRDMKANPSKFEKRPGTLVDGNGNNLNLFLENLQIYSKENGDEYLTIPSLGNASDNIKVGIQESLKQLKIYTGIDMESLMFNYHLIEDGVSDKKGSSASLISKDYLINYDSFLSELHSNINQQAGSIALRYEDRLAVHMLDHLPSNSRTENIKGDFELNYKYSDKSTDKTYEGGIIPKYRTENNPEYRPIEEFPEFISAYTPISGEKITYEPKLYKGLFKLEKIEDPEIVEGASVDNPVWRYVRVTNRVSEMLSSWGVNSTVKEVYGKSDQGRTLHIIPLKKLKDLNNGRTVTINPADMSSDYDVLSKYKNGKYIVKTGQVVDVKRFRVGGKTGLKITLDNLTSSENPLDASMVNDFEGSSNYPGVDFKTREQVLKSVDPAAIPNYNTAITNDYFTIGNNHSLVSSISSKSLNHPMAILADAFLKSNMSARLKSTAVIFKSAIANPEAFKGFSQEDVGRVAAYYDQENNIIVFNSDISNSAGGIERVGLHEVTHVYSSDVLNRYLAGKPLKNNERVFAKYIVDLHAYVSKNINKALADKTIDEINSISGTIEYAISNPKEFLSEIFTKKSFQDVMMKMNAMNPEVAKLGVKNIWQEFVSVMKDLFFGKAIPKELNSVFDEVMAVSSRYMEGESMFEVSQLNRYDSSQGYNMYLPESMAKDASKANGSKDPTPQELRDNYYGFGVKVDKITNNNDLITAMVRADIKKEGNDPNNVTAVNNLYNAIIKEMSSKFAVFGKFTYMANGKVYELDNITDKDAVTNLAKQIIKERSSYEVTLKDSLVNFLKGNVYTSFSKDVESNLPWLKGKFAVNPTTDVVNLLSNSKFKSDFFDKETFDPIIIHSDSDISGKAHISIMDMTTRQLTTKLTPSGSAEYLADFITKYNPNAIKQGSFRLLKTEAGMRKFNLMLSAMLIHSKNPNIVIDKMSIIKPTGKSNSESYDVMYWDHLPEMKAILTDPIIKDILPKELKDLINNPKAFDIPEVNYLTSLASFYYDVKERYFNEALDSGKPVDTRAFEFEEMGTNLQKNDNLIGHNIFRPDVIRMLTKRINAIREYSKDKEVDIVANEEMRYLSKAIELITYKGPKDQKMEDISDLVGFLGLNYNISNPAYDMYRTSVMSAIETGKTKYISYKTGFDKIMDKIRKLPFGFTDVGYKYFKRLYIHTDATDKQGNVRNINSYSIHHSGNLKSLEAVKKSELSKDELELGDYIVKTIKEGLIEKQIAKGLSLEDAKNWYDANWQDGMVPIMAKRVSEKIFTKDAIAGLKQWLTKYSTSNEFFDYIDKGATSPYEVSDQFLFQAGNSPFGSAERMNKIGLYMDNSTGKITINGVTPEEIQKSLKTNQDEVEQNLEVVMAYFTMNHHQKTELDKTQNMYLAAQTILHNYEAKASDNPLDGRLTNLRAYMRDMNDFIVMGKRKRINSAIKIGNVKIQVDDIINVAGSTTAAAVLFFNVFADFKNLSLNSLMFQALAFSHTAAGAKGLYGEKDAFKALGTISTNPMLAKALSWQYKMAGMDRSNLLNNPRHLPTTKAVLDTRHGYFGQFIGDYGIRTASLLAYMNNKGVLDAHRLNKDGDLIYDETKDARMYKDGKLTENGKLIKMELLKNMKEQGIFFGKVDLDSKLPQAFDNDLRDSIKTISDKFITGGAYDDATALNLEAHSIGKMFAVFKRYLPDKLQNFYLKGNENPAIFDYVVKDVEIGGETKATVVKEHMYIEGMVQSIAGLWSEARKISASGDYKTISEMWKNQKDIRRINLIRVTHDIIFANIMLSVLPILFGDDEMTEEERRHASEVMSSPIGKAFNYSIQDMINPYKPNDYFNAIAEPFFALTALKKQLEVFPALLGTTEGALDKWAEKNLGFYKSIEAVSGNLSGTKSDKAKKKKYKKEIQKNN